MNYNFFFGKQEFLSQWFECKFIEDGITFNSAEQYMMYRKAILFNDINIAKLILQKKSQREIKALGRIVSNFDDKIWKLHREKIVFQGNYLKFSQNRDLLIRLTSLNEGKPSLNNPIFVEASPYDRIWGIGFSKENAMANKNNWGLNLLGKTLNKLYEEFTFEKKEFDKEY